MCGRDCVEAMTGIRTAVVGVTAVCVLSPVAAHAAAGLSVTADSARRGADRATVRLSGSYTCGPFSSGRPDRGVIDLEVTQVQGAVSLRAIGYLEPQICDGRQQRYTVTLTEVAGSRFRLGAAAWSASGYVEGDTGLQHVHVPPTAITIR